jgi:hypothetical protein
VWGLAWKYFERDYKVTREKGGPEWARIERLTTWSVLGAAILGPIAISAIVIWLDAREGRPADLRQICRRPKLAWSRIAGLRTALARAGVESGVEKPRKPTACHAEGPTSKCDTRVAFGRPLANWRKVADRPSVWPQDDQIAIVAADRSL